jgi:hypothetical protein
VIVTVIAMRMMEVIANEVIDVIFVLHHAMSATRTMDVRRFVRSAGMR